MCVARRGSDAPRGTAVRARRAALLTSIAILSSFRLLLPHMQVAVPGFSAADFSADVRGRVLQVNGARESEGARVVIRRSVALPAGTPPEAVKVWRQQAARAMIHNRSPDTLPIEHRRRNADGMQPPETISLRCCPSAGGVRQRRPWRVASARRPRRPLYRDPGPRRCRAHLPAAGCRCEESGHRGGRRHHLCVNKARSGRGGVASKGAVEEDSAPPAAERGGMT